MSSSYIPPIPSARAHGFSLVILGFIPYKAIIAPYYNTVPILQYAMSLSVRAAPDRDITFLPPPFPPCPSLLGVGAPATGDDQLVIKFDRSPGPLGRSGTQGAVNCTSFAVINIGEKSSQYKNMPTVQIKTKDFSYPFRGSSFPVDIS